jgi:hypothetical protein
MLTCVAVWSVTYKTSFGLDYRIYWHIIHASRDYRQLQRYCWSTPLKVHRYTRTGVLSLTSRILATDLSQVSLSLQITHEVFFSQPNSILAITLQLPIPKTRLHSCHILAGWRLELDSQFFSNELFYIATLHGPRRKHSLSVVERACLQRRCIATEVTRLLLAYSLPRECVYRVFV